MSHRIKQLLRSGLVLAVSLATTVALSFPALARPMSSQGSSPPAPSPRSEMGMTYDAARGEVLLFGGRGRRARLDGDTWTWNGTSWTQRFPAHSPAPREVPGMAYDAARGQVVLFGGASDTYRLGDTWTWNGTDWTQRFPAHSPPPSNDMGMAYDPAEGMVLLFGGCCALSTGDPFGDTWAWDGTDWTQLSPAHSPSPRADMGMAYDAARGTIVLFGGDGGYGTGLLQDTWAWDGTDWTQLSPAHSPSPRRDMGMAYDGSRGQVVLFGGLNLDPPYELGDTWAWDGTDWTQFSPARFPGDRSDPGMTYDAGRAVVVLFGGGNVLAGDTWGWNGTDWSLLTIGSIKLSPRSGPLGTTATLRGAGFSAFDWIKLSFVDSAQGRIDLGWARAYGSGRFKTEITIPVGATLGRQRVRARGTWSGEIASRTFTVT